MNQQNSITTLSVEEMEQVSGALFGFGCAPCGGGTNLLGGLFGTVAQVATGVVGLGLSIEAAKLNLAAGVINTGVNLVGGLLGGLFGGSCAPVRPCK
jgi:hypothetical protein